MGIFDGCLLVSDIDGTLLYHGTIADENIKAIRYFEQNGGYFTVATGRGIGAFDEEYKISESNVPAIGIHGGTVYDFYKDETLYLNALGDEDKQAIVAVAKQFPEAGFEVFCDGRMNICRRSKDIDWHAEYEHVNATYEPVENIMDRNWSKVVFSTEGGMEHKMLEYAQTLKTDKGIFHITSAVLVKLLELYPASNKKSTAMYFLADHLGVSHDRVFSIGDYFNDLDMIEHAKIGAAVNGSPKEIIDASKYVTKASCQEGAVADFIYYIEEQLKNGTL